MTRIAIAVAFVRSDLREGAVRTEDGDYCVIEDFTVLAELEDGSRFEHKVRFAGRCGTNEDGFGYPVAGDAAAAEALAARVNAAGSIDPAHWHWAEACYGSEAYVRTGGEQRLREWELGR